ncbi:MAG TPA: hypothetical protein DD670_09515 [Planctomycetaceae bacterium]|nr:hypothetical protein [Planctomycetaceae bacterium]
MHTPSPASDAPEFSPRRDSRSPDGDRKALWGLLLCVAAALGYSVVNACLRKLTDDCDRVLVIFVKELVTVLVVGPWIAMSALRGRRIMPGNRALAALAVAGLLTQLGGNLPNIWALSVLGLAVAIPIMSGTNMVGTAILGRVFLGERVSPRTIGAIGMLFASILLLRMAAGETDRAPVGLSLATLAVLASCGAGIVYAVLVVVIRRNVTHDTPISAVLFLVTVMGVVSLGPWLATHGGIDVVRNTAATDHALMWFAGLLNLLAFVAFTHGLRWTRAAHANTIMTSQVVLAAVFGAALFDERISLWMVAGVCLTIIGMILIGREVRLEPETPETPI